MSSEEPPDPASFDRGRLLGGGDVSPDFEVHVATGRGR